MPQVCVGGGEGEGSGGDDRRCTRRACYLRGVCLGGGAQMDGGWGTGADVAALCRTAEFQNPAPGFRNPAPSRAQAALFVQPVEEELL